MEPAEARARAERILEELGKYPTGLFTLDENLFLTCRCRRLPGAKAMVVLAFAEPDLRELEKIARRVKKASRKNFKLLRFPPP
jgi:hypothetical protein